MPCRRRYVALLTATVAVVAGCSRSEFVEVTGNVSWQGQAVDVGELIFAPVDKSVTPAAGRIREGDFKRFGDGECGVVSHRSPTSEAGVMP